MPKANWGISASDVDEFDRDSQYKPYDGPEPPTNTVFLFRVKRLKRAAGTKDKFPQLRIGLELVPREDREDEEQYEGFYIMDFAPISDKTAFRYVPFLDAIGVTGREFERGTVFDADQNIRKIGKWRNTGEELVLATLKDGEDAKGKPRLEVGTYMSAEDYYGNDEDDDEYYDDEEG